MAKHRGKINIRTMILAVAGVAGLVVFLLNYWIGKENKEVIHHPVKEVRGNVDHPVEEVRGNVDNPVGEVRGNVAIRFQKKSKQTASMFSIPSKVVLMHSFPYWYELKSGSGAFLGCNDSCILTLDTGLIEDADSVILYAHSADSKISPSLLLRNQIVIFFAVESPLNYGTDFYGTPEWENRFNWTMTYRRESDFYFGYGDFVKQPSPLMSRDVTSLVAGKSKMAAWFVSNCQSHSKREQFTEALKAFIQVDIYGACGPLKCEKENNQGCMAMLSKDYYFYLSLENSMCTDYITEKAYYIMKQADIIPVVRGGASYTALFPKNSFIDAAQFPSVKALADYLKVVASDKKLYQSYLDWKKEWKVIEPIPFSFCELCHRLHNKQKWARVYPNVHSWWSSGSCFEPPALVWGL